MSTVNARPSRYAITESGVVKPKASPELLPEVLRKLPSDLVTKDIEVEDKAHKEDIDTPHVIKSIAKDRAKQELGEKPIDPFAKEPEPIPDEDPRLNQHMIDIRRLCVLREWANTQKSFIARGKPSDVSVKHLWFPENDHRNYVLRSGNPPPDSQRPKHLRGYHLEIDLGAKELPGEITKLLKERGVPVPSGYAGLVKQAMNLNRVLTADGEVWGG
jgi:hypothetical protein